MVNAVKKSIDEVCEITRHLACSDKLKNIRKSPFCSDAFSRVKGNAISNVEDFLYTSTLENVDTIIIFKAPEVREHWELAERMSLVDMQ